ncbi:MAG: hypothetical protein FJ308_05910, partial [Planctomycetes bacterium]|nr:hypothetical protein [Planctomycetota bacterium]
PSGQHPSGQHPSGQHPSGQHPSGQHQHQQLHHHQQHLLEHRDADLDVDVASHLRVPSDPPDHPMVPNPLRRWQRHWEAVAPKLRTEPSMVDSDNAIPHTDAGRTPRLAWCGNDRN